MAKHKRRSKAGRPRKAGPRTPSGRLSRAYRTVARDDGTAELRRHKLALVNGATDPSLSAGLATILFAHGVLDQRQRVAADRFRSARAAVFGAVLADRDPNRPEVGEDRAKQNELRYTRMLALLSEDQALELVNLALDLKAPWMRRALLGLLPAADDLVERGHLLSGLDVLADE